MWLQPEPLLYLGLTNGDLASPRGYTGVYAAANPLLFGDRTGRWPNLEALRQGRGGPLSAEAAASLRQQQAENSEAPNALVADAGGTIRSVLPEGSIHGSHGASWDPAATSAKLAPEETLVGGTHRHPTTANASGGDVNAVRDHVAEGASISLEATVGPTGDRAVLLVVTAGTPATERPRDTEGVMTKRPTNPMNGGLTQEAAAEFEATYGVYYYEVDIAAQQVWRPAAGERPIQMTP
jgi:hypothetical protein